MNIYRTFQTVSSHPATRVSECSHRNVTSVYAVTACAPFVSKDAIVPKWSEHRPTVTKHDIRMTVHTQRCVLCVCGSVRISLIYPTLLLLGSLGPNWTAPPPITAGLCPFCRRLARTCLLSLSRNVLSLSHDVAPGPPLTTSLHLSLLRTQHAGKATR